MLSGVNDDKNLLNILEEVSQRIWDINWYLQDHISLYWSNWSILSKCQAMRWRWAMEIIWLQEHSPSRSFQALRRTWRTKPIQNGDCRYVLRHVQVEDAELYLQFMGEENQSFCFKNIGTRTWMSDEVLDSVKQNTCKWSVPKNGLPILCWPEGFGAFHAG